MGSQGSAIAFDRAESARIADLNGWYEVKGNPLSKVGVFPYLGSSVPGAPEPGRVYMVYRPAAELADPECLASFRLLPWIDDHVMLGAEESGLTPAEQKGVHGVIGEDVYFDGDEHGGYVRGNLKIFSSAMANLIEHGKRELSAGYRCVYDFTPGVFNGVPYDAVQRGIRGNHLALVAQGRMGPDVAVLDHVFNFTVDSMEAHNMSDEEKKDGGELAQISAALEKLGPILAAVEELKAGAAAKAAPAAGDEGKEGELSEEDKAKAAAEQIDTAAKIGALDSAIKGLRADVQTIADSLKNRAPAMDAAAVAADFAKRDAVAAKLSHHIGAFDHASMTYAGVCAYGVEKLGLADVPKGAEGVALDAYLKDRDVPRSITHATDAAPTGSVAAYLKGA
jgi:hypothetical protein